MALPRQVCRTMTVEPMLMMLPPCSPKCFDCFAADEKQAEDVGVEVAVELFFGELIERAEFEDASVVDEDVELAEGLLRLGEEALDVSGFGNIGLDGDGFASARGDSGDNVFCAFAAGCVVDDDGCAFFGEFPRDGCADALRCSGDDGDFAC